MLTLEEIQKRIDAMPAAMAAKGKRQANAEFTVRANEAPHIYLMWHTETRGIGDGFQFIRADTLVGLLDAADKWIAALPSIEKAHMQEFMAALGAVIEKGKSSGIDVAFVNPLVETMKRLSKNALTDQRAA